MDARREKRKSLLLCLAGVILFFVLMNLHEGIQGPWPWGSHMDGWLQETHPVVQYEIWMSASRTAWGWPWNFVVWTNKVSGMRSHDQAGRTLVRYLPGDAIPDEVMTAARRTLPEVFDPNEGCVFLGSVTTRSIDAWGIIKSFFLFVLLALEAWGLWYLAKHRDRKALLLMLLVITCLLFVTLRGLLQTWHGVHVYSRSASGKLSGGERGPVNASSKGSFVPSGHSDTPYDVVWGDVSSWDLGWPFTYAGLVKRTNGFCTVQANGIATEYSPNTMTPATLSDVMRETDAAIVAKQRGTISPPMGALAKTIDPIVFMPGSGWTFLGTAYTWRFYSTYLTLDAAFWLAAGFIIWGFLRGFTQHKGRGFEVILIDKKAVGSDCPVTAWEAEPKE